MQWEKIQAPVEETPVKEVLKDLKVNIAFTDKYDDKINYKVNDVIKADSISNERYNELLNDERKIVSVVD